MALDSPLQKRQDTTAEKCADPAVDTAAMEWEIDERVYRLYGLAEEEIGIVQGQDSCR
jgi:hypothetical protein